jgi:LAO/AO transport system kinase
MPDAAEQATGPLAERLVGGDKRALARAISLVENRDPEGDRLVAELYPRTGGARIVGLTGPPGVGKSTLIGAICARLREGGREIGVLSTDPSVDYSHGLAITSILHTDDHSHVEHARREPTMRQARIFVAVLGKRHE